MLDDSDSQSLGIRHLVQEQDRVHRAITKSSCLVSDAFTDEVVSEEDYELVGPDKGLTDPHGVGKPSRCVLLNVGHRSTPPRTVANRGHDLFTSHREICWNHDADFSDPGVYEVFDGVEQNWLVGNRY